MDVKGLLSQLTVEEKTALVAGTDFMYTNPLPRHGIPSLRMSDGPHGLRVQQDGGDNGVTGSAPATAFPTAATVASSWNAENARAIGKAIGKEAHSYGIHVVLGPGANVKRNPLAGRNFEYFSEDPLLAGKLAVAEVEGIQSQGVGVSVKHFALNNTENFRFMGNSIADMRAIREIYLKVFEIIVKESKPASVMCAYNKINGEFCSQNKWLLTDVLRGEWGFEGLVMTDWGAMHDRIASLKAGLDLEMPGDTLICRKWIADGIKEGTLSVQQLDAAAENVLRLVDRYVRSFDDDCDFCSHDALARQVAADSAVLLKNDGILPLSAEEEYAVCGDLFEKMRYQGAGSSMINPVRLTSPKQAFDAAKIKYEFFRGYSENKTAAEAQLAEQAAKGAGDVVIAFLGLTDYVESEGCDRENMRLPQNQLDLVERLVSEGKKVVAVLFGGAPVELPFADKVSAILNMYLPGQNGGSACADLLFGRTNPSGRLAETWPLRYSDVPCGESFGKTENEVYKESVFVGYRYYLTAKKQVRYPFGYGLSYTQFDYSDFNVCRSEDRIVARCTVKNVGTMRGAEVVQLYSALPDSAISRPARELRAFEKVYLDAGESAEVKLEFPVERLAYYDVGTNSWQVEAGRYRIEFCRDAASPLYGAEVQTEGQKPSAIHGEAGALYSAANVESVTDRQFEKMSGVKIPPLPAKKPITVESRFCYMKQAGLMGKILYSAVVGVADKQMKKALKMAEGTERDNKIKGAYFMKRILESNSVISMSMSAGKAFPYNFAEGMVNLANGRIIRGIKCMCRKIKAPALPKDQK